MYKIIITAVSFLIFFNIFLPKAFSYQNFDGKYNYNQYNQTSNIQIQDEEVLFIVDFSGSMNNRLGFTPKAYLVIKAINNIIKDTEDSTKIGLRIFGPFNKTKNADPFVVYTPNANIVYVKKEDICTASSLILPIARYNSQNIEDKLSNINPNGATPIGYSLRQAVQNDFLNNTSMKHIILITDGGENCGDDPCLYIKKLMKMRNDIKIDVIGITVDKNAYSELNCIANAGKGKYFSINSEDEFEIKFKQAFKATPQIKTKMNSTSKQLTSKTDDSIKYKNYVLQFDF